MDGAVNLGSSFTSPVRTIQQGLLDNTTISVIASVYFNTQRFSSVYEPARILSGQGAGLNVMTHGPQVMCFHTDNVPAIEISGTENRM